MTTSRSHPPPTSSLFNLVLYPPFLLAVLLNREAGMLSRTPRTAATATAPVALIISPTRPVPSVLIRRPVVGHSNAAVSGNKPRRCVCWMITNSAHQKASRRESEEDLSTGKIMPPGDASYSIFGGTNL